MSRFVFLLSCSIILIGSGIVMAHLDSPERGRTAHSGLSPLEVCMKTRDFCGRN